MNNRFARLAKPYLIWLYVLAVLPALVMALLVFTDMEGLDLQNMSITLANFAQLAEVSTLVAFKNSFVLSLITTLISIVLGYLVAYKLFRSNFKNKFLILVILILPMWSNILLRTEALSNLFSASNIVTTLLDKIRIMFGADPEQVASNPVTFLDVRGSDNEFAAYFAVVFGLVVTYVPFMIMPIYNSLEKIDRSVEEAALDLGLTDMQKFWKVIFPMSSKGIITGSIMVFLPSLSGFAIPKILGGGRIVMIGNVIEELFNNMNYNVGSLLAMVILIVILISITIVNKVDKEGEMLL